VKGMINATRAVSFILMFLVLCMYVFSIVFTAQLGNPDAPEHKYPLPYWESDTDPTAMELFGSLGDSMITLFTRGMLADNLAETLEAIKDRGGDIVCEGSGEPGFAPSAEVCERTGGELWLMWCFILFMIISAFCLLNMLIGVLCEVITDSAQKENESTQIAELHKNMKMAFMEIDTSKDGKITKTEWQQMRNQKTVQESMESLGVEQQHMEERLDQMQESLFGGMDDEEDDEDIPDHKRVGLTFEEFIGKVVEIRPDTPASALDIEILRVRVEREEKAFNARLDFIQDALQSVNGQQALPAPTSQAYPTATKAPVKAVEAADPKANSFTAWLTDVPTEVLFAVLNSRAPPELSSPPILGRLNQ